MSITVKVKLKDGLYRLNNGDDCDNHPCWGLLVIYAGKFYFSGYAVHSRVVDVLKAVEITDGEDLFEKLNVYNHIRTT